MIRRLFSESLHLKFPPIYPENIDQLRKMIWYRCGRTGTQETEYLLKEWAKSNLNKMNRDELILFHQQVIDQETLDLYQILMGHQPHNGLKYLEKLTKFVQSKLE
jgi:succinate dehydrogenase flavin-adding protein (antitoxin of CptAB toxin-antitoxin module)